MTIDIPEDAREYVRALARRRCAEARHRIERERVAAAQRRSAENRRRSRRLPLAEQIFHWAGSVAATGVLDGLGDEGFLLYRSSGRGRTLLVAVRFDSAVLVTSKGRLGGRRWVVADAEALVEHLDLSCLREIVSRIGSRDVWRAVEPASDSD